MPRPKKLTDIDISQFLEDSLKLTSVSEFKVLCDLYEVTYITGLKVIKANGTYKYLQGNKIRIEAYKHYQTLQNYKRKLSNEEIIRIFNDAQEAKLIAKKHNISLQTVLNIKNCKGRYKKIIESHYINRHCTHVTNEHNTNTLNDLINKIKLEMKRIGLSALEIKL